MVQCSGRNGTRDVPGPAYVDGKQDVNRRQAANVRRWHSYRQPHGCACRAHVFGAGGMRCRARRDERHAGCGGCDTDGGGRARDHLAAVERGPEQSQPHRAQRCRRGGETTEQRTPLGSPLELRAQRTPCPEEERGDGAGRDTESRRDLSRAQATDLTHQQRRPLVQGQSRQRGLQLRHGRCVGIDLRRGFVVELDLDDPPLPVVTAARVAGDRMQPSTRRVGLRAALHRRVRVHERDLREVFGVLAIPREPEHGPEDLRAMSLNQSLERLGQGGRLATPSRRHNGKTPTRRRPIRCPRTNSPSSRLFYS